jgi:hypothetical protein
LVTGRFRAGDVELPLGVEDDFRPAGEAHPGIIVDDLDAFVECLATQAGIGSLSLRRLNLLGPLVVPPRAPYRSSSARWPPEGAEHGYPWPRVQATSLLRRTPSPQARRQLGRSQDAKT